MYVARDLPGAMTCSKGMSAAAALRAVTDTVIAARSASAGVFVFISEVRKVSSWVIVGREDC